MSEAMNELIKDALADRAVLAEIVANPAAVGSKYGLAPEELAALAANTARSLGTLVGAGILAAGCGSSPTCPESCTASCTVTFTSFADPNVAVNPVVRPG